MSAMAESPSKHGLRCSADRQTDRQTGRQTDRQTYTSLSRTVWQSCRAIVGYLKKMASTTRYG